MEYTTNQCTQPPDMEAHGLDMEPSINYDDLELDGDSVRAAFSAKIAILVVIMSIWLICDSARIALSLPLV